VGVVPHAEYFLLKMALSVLVGEEKFSGSSCAAAEVSAGIVIFVAEPPMNDAAGARKKRKI